MFIHLSIPTHCQGSSKANVHMEWDKLWSFNKKVIDPSAPRHTALTRANLVKVTVDGIAGVESRAIPMHPKNEEVGKKQVRNADMMAALRLCRCGSPTRFCSRLRMRPR